MSTPDPSVRTVYLGQFERETAERLAAAFEEAGIVWTYKQFGGLVKLLFAGDWGVRLFIDRARVAEARTIVERVVQEGTNPREPD